MLLMLLYSYLDLLLKELDLLLKELDLLRPLMVLKHHQNAHHYQQTKPEEGNTWVC